jgi:hypothetical protein
MSLPRSLILEWLAGSSNIGNSSEVEFVGVLAQISALSGRDGPDRGKFWNEM